ncbi:MAG: restriction endonuclease subunit S [Endozoicomonas sp.]|uniref:restriction endonuclease subunit S n=1 Tax=Endozoicomonas sp. TaxID=1892382 RepID=UPI003D9BC6C9
MSSIGEVALNTNNLRKPISLAKRAEIKGNYPYFGATGQIDSLNDFTHEGEHILIGEDGANLLSKSKPLAFIVGGKYWVNNHAHALKMLGGMPCTYISLYVNSLDLKPWVTGSAQPKLNKGNLDVIPVPVPPLAEQKVIAKKLDTLLAQVENTKARLERTRETLKRFRQSVLAAAVNGKLTHADASRWETLEFSKLLRQLRSGSAEKPSSLEAGVPILRSSAVRRMVIDYQDIKHLEDSPKINEDNFLKNGDLIFTRLSGSAEYVGNCALVKGLTHKVQYPDRLFCARLKDQSHAQYLEYFFSSDKFTSHIYSSLKSSAGHQRITLDVIKKAAIVLPPLEDQLKIVKKIEQLFTHADTIEKQTEAALAKVSNLTQSILAKAFRGELTEQWRKDNPELISGENSAEALLEKIKAERAIMAAGQGKPKKRARTGPGRAA